MFRLWLLKPRDNGIGIPTGQDRIFSRNLEERVRGNIAIPTGRESRKKGQKHKMLTPCRVHRKVVVLKQHGNNMYTYLLDFVPTEDLVVD